MIPHFATYDTCATYLQDSFCSVRSSESYFVYDTNGNMVGRYSNSMTYDVENRLTRNSHSSGTTDYTYNGDSTRVKKVVTVGGDVTTTIYVGNLYEYTSWSGGSSWSKYYYFGGKRMAMRTAQGVTYLHSDQLGSTTETSGATTSNQTYYAYGAVRLTSGNVPTDFAFTGQRQDETAGLLYYGARYYDPGLGRFTQPDSIVPDPLDPQSLNRYTYARNNPVRFVDPSGHDPLDQQWVDDFYQNNGAMPTDQDRRDRLYSLMFAGSGDNGAWTGSDWANYYANREQLWEGAVPWPGAPEPGLDRFVEHLDQLATHYNSGEEENFIRAVGFVWAGIPSEGNAIVAGVATAWNPEAADDRFPFLEEGITNWNVSLTDVQTGDFNPSHHYAAFVYTGYFFGRRNAEVAGWVRDREVPEDILLGNIGASHGAMVRWGVLDMSQVGSAARYALDERPGLWANPPPGTPPWWWGLVQ